MIPSAIERMPADPTLDWVLVWLMIVALAVCLGWMIRQYKDARGGDE